MTDPLREKLDAICGVESTPEFARDAVNQPMIRHWCDAMDDRNPVYTDPEFAAASEQGGIVAPPTMLQAWTMRGLRPPVRPAGGTEPLGQVMMLLEDAGYTSVVATNCRQEYPRYLRPGELLSHSSYVESVSDEKQTGLGIGRFVTQIMVFRSDQGDEVARMVFRILKFKPGTGRKPPAADASEEGGEAQALRPRPSMTDDTRFFWEGVDEGRLLIQRCSECGRLRHPPGPACPACHSLEWETQEASGRGSVYSFVRFHHPPLPAFEHPNPIVLVELEEGTRLVSNLVGVEPGKIEIGMPVQVDFSQVDPELRLPLFRPVS